MDKIITIYYRGNCNSSRETINWFRVRNIGVEVVNVNRISKENIIKLLMSSDTGFFSILKSPKGNYYTQQYDDLESMSFNEALLYLKKNTSMIRSPIVINGDRTMVGYNSEEIRQFIPKEIRKIRKSLLKI